VPVGLSHLQALEPLAVALAIGLLIGLERGWERREMPEGRRAAGLRTFGIIGLLGGVAVELGTPWMLAAVALVVGLFVALGYWRESEVDKDVSLTTAITSMLTLCLGALAATGNLTAAASSAVVVTLLLSFKPELHGILRRLERAEMLATLRLLLISVVLLPVLPDHGFGPWAAFNPYRIWWLVVLVAGVSYVGYFAVKLLGERRGTLASGFFGGLVSSTAVTLNLSREAADSGHGINLLSAGVAVGAAMMFPRMLVIVGVVAPALALQLIWPLGAAFVASAAAAAWYATRHSDRERSQDQPHADPGNPLDLRTALEFGVVLAIIMVLSRGAIVWMGDRGLYLLAAISGLVDVDAISLSVATMSVHGHVSLGVAARTTLIAAGVNTLLKPALSMFVGGPHIALRVLKAALAATIAGAAAYAAVAY